MGWGLNPWDSTGIGAILVPGRNIFESDPFYPLYNIYPFGHAEYPLAMNPRHRVVCDTAAMMELDSYTVKLNAAADSLFPENTFKLKGPSDTLRYYPFQWSTQYDGYENGQYVGVIVSVRGGMADTAMYSRLYRYAEYDLTYHRLTVGYPGKLELTITNGSPGLQRQLYSDSSEAYEWEFNRDWNTGEYDACTSSLIYSLNDDGFILIREPNTCFPVDTLWLRPDTGVKAIMRPVYLPVIQGATLIGLKGSRWWKAGRILNSSSTPMPV